MGKLWRTAAVAIEECEGEEGRETRDVRRSIWGGEMVPTERIVVDGGCSVVAGLEYEEARWKLCGRQLGRHAASTG